MTSPIIATLTTELADALKKRSNAALAAIVQSNSATIYFRESPALLEFRKDLTALRNESKFATGFPDPPDIAHIFSTVPLSTYEDYSPFIDRFNENPCRVSRVSDLLAPGLPVYLSNSSSTTNGPLKIFPKHHMAVTGHPLAKKIFGGNACVIINMRIRQHFDIMGDGPDQGRKIGSIPSCFLTGNLVQMINGIGYNDDDLLMPLKFPNLTSPYAAHFIQPYETFILIHGLFAIADPSLSAIVTTFSSLIYDYTRLLAQHWEQLVQAIDTGILPTFDGLDDLANYLQAHLQPNAHRAAELRDVAVGTEGWLNKIWPELINVVGVFGGPYIAAVPKIRHHFGPSVNLISSIYGMTECEIGTPYNPQDLNLFKVDSVNFVEYLSIDKPESAEELCCSWNIEVGRRYELVVTTEDGLWRYRLGDVLEVAGFDPADGQPLLRYIERRTMTLRVWNEFMTERMLRDGLNSLKVCLGDVLEFTSFADDRKSPPGYGFMVELDSTTRHVSKEAIPRLHSFFCANNRDYEQFVEIEFIGKPTIRIVAPGTFRLYRDWKSRGRNGVSVKIKVPAVMHDTSSREWLLRQVMFEL